MKRLKKILSYRRGHGSAGERKFCYDLLAAYSPTPFLHATTREPLAYVVDVATPDGVVPPVLWCCHIDTVHAVSDVTRQEVMYDEDIALFYKNDNEPLGADDGAGIWLLMEMIDAKVPGSYIFHRGEERGGVGSSGMAEQHTDWLSRFKWAIAFDRKDCGDVITTQFVGRCCSDEFAQALAVVLNTTGGFMYRPDDTGVFTDTANYRRIIPECTNLSVGYESEHTMHEMLDAGHVQSLRDTLVKSFTAGIDLPVKRDKDAIDQYEYDWMDYRQYPSFTKDWKDNVHEFGKRTGQKTKRYKKDKVSTVDWRDYKNVPENASDVLTLTFEEVAEFVREGHTSDVAELLMNLAQEVVDLDSYIESTEVQPMDAEDTVPQ